MHLTLCRSSSLSSLLRSSSPSSSLWLIFYPSILKERLWKGRQILTGTYSTYMRRSQPNDLLRRHYLPIILAYLPIDFLPYLPYQSYLPTYLPYQRDCPGTDWVWTALWHAPGCHPQRRSSTIQTLHILLSQVPLS